LRRGWHRVATWEDFRYQELGTLQGRLAGHGNALIVRLLAQRQRAMIAAKVATLKAHQTKSGDRQICLSQSDAAKLLHVSEGVINLLLVRVLGLLVLLTAFAHGVGG